MCVCVCEGVCRAGLRHWGAPCQRVMGALLFPPLPFPLRPFPPPSPLSPSPSSRPSSAISLPSFYLFSFRSGHLNTAMGPGERYKLPQWGLGQSPSRQTIWCIIESKRAALVAATKSFCGVLRKNICNFHYFLHKNN